MSRYLTTFRLAAAFVLLLLSATRPAKAQSDYGNNATYQEFYDELSPYGEWIDDPQNGYVWVPDAGDDFRPYYSNGYWTNTEYGNTWVSDYDWGWAPFHYGRWTYNNYYGWVWIPGNVWGPAWVSWRSGGGCYGWAPLGPGVSINLSFGNGYYAPDYWWTFTPQQYILNPRFHQYSYGPRYNSKYIRQTTIINNTYVYKNRTYVTGPRRNELERATGRPVQVVSIRNSTRPNRAQLRDNSLSMYRPAIAESRPRTTERPRQFRAAEQPITTAPREIDRTAIRQSARDRSQTIQRDPTQTIQRDRTQTTDRPVRSDNDGATIERQPNINRRPVDRTPVQQADPRPARPVEMQQPQRDRAGWNGGNRAPDRTPMQQPQQQRIERAPINRNMETPRVQQAQPTPQQRIERPTMERQQPVQQQRIESPRMESPRATPQREAPAAQPQRVERSQPGLEGGRPSRR